MKESTEQVYRQRILRVQMVIQQNLDRELPLEELARESYFSEYHFHRIFRAVVGEPLKEYIRRLRLERAASHLKYTSNSITHIALDAGYQTHEAFTRAFKSAFGCSPSDFRSGNSATTHYQSDSDKKELHSDEGDYPMKVEIKNIDKMRVAFVLHVGPYDKEGETVGQMEAFAEQQGMEFHGRHHDIYLSDPRRVPPERLKTILRHPVRKKAV